jgi:hypothetical protein
MKRLEMLRVLSVSILAVVLLIGVCEKGYSRTT